MANTNEDAALLNVLNSKEPIFEFSDDNGSYKIYLDGRVEGAKGDVFRINMAARVVNIFRARLANAERQLNGR